ncbi:hypothetical protein pipiens_007335 [Culex pipiens pipiens]|uniref:C2H2-type domain-containing protein n=1 Tax=Culex pipiens pipiens TaxID=38569 RepID=A0ABD1DLJ9_CULPP
MDPFCAFCLRTSPANVDFFKHVVGSTVELRQSFQSMLGYNFPLENFSICNPCWKLMQLVQDFRTRCFKANSLVERIGQGLSSEDDWFSAKNLATIESVRMVIKDQMQQIGRVDVTWDEFRATDHDMNVEQKEDLQKCVKQIQSCTICKETLPNNKQLMDHYRRVHPGEQRHKCSQCELRFTAKFTRQQHERRHHPECLTEHICPECGKRFSREGDLKYHIKYHRLERPHQCEICQKRVTSPKALQEHVARMHPELATEQSLRRVAQMQRATDKWKAQYSKKDEKEPGNGEGILNF